MINDPTICAQCKNMTLLPATRASLPHPLQRAGTCRALPARALPVRPPQLPGEEVCRLPLGAGAEAAQRAGALRQHVQGGAAPGPHHPHRRPGARFTKRGLGYSRSVCFAMNTQLSSSNSRGSRDEPGLDVCSTCGGQWRSPGAAAPGQASASVSPTPSSSWPRLCRYGATCLCTALGAGLPHGLHYIPFQAAWMTWDAPCCRRASTPRNKKLRGRERPLVSR